MVGPLYVVLPASRGPNVRVALGLTAIPPMEVDMLSRLLMIIWPSAIEYAPVNVLEVGAKVIAPPPTKLNAPAPLKGLENVPAVDWFKSNIPDALMLRALVEGKLDMLFTCKVPLDTVVPPL